jgi:LPS export ABC transporter protein LptC
MMWRSVVPPAVLALAFATVASGCSSQPGPAASPSPDVAASGSPAPSASATGAASTPPPVNFYGQRVGSHYVYATKQKGAKTVYVLRADSVDAVYNGALTGRSNFTNPHVTFFGQAGKRLVADAPAGTVVEKDKTVVMTGGVRARTQDGMTLSSDTMRYQDDTQMVHGAGHVIVTLTTGEQLRGDTVDWNLKDGHINMGGQ